MNALTLHLLLLGTAAVLIALSVYFYKNQKVTSSAEFVMAGRRVNPGFMIASFIATWMWGADIAAVPQTVYYTGVAGIWYYGLPVLIGGILAAVVIHRVRKVFPEVVTYQHFFKKRLDSKNHIVFIVIGIYTMIIAATLQIRVGGEVLGAMTDLDPLYICALLLLIIIAYTMISGLWGSIATDYIQFATAAILTVIFVPIIVFNAGGPAEIYARVDEHWSDINPGILSFDGVSWGHMYEFFLPFVFVWGVWGLASMSIWQRGLAVRRDRISRTFVFGSIGWFSTIPVYGIIGLVALAYFPELTGPGADFSVDESDQAGIRVFTEFLGGGALIVFAATLISLLISTADSAVAALASLASKDIYQEYINPHGSEESTLAVARWSVPVTGLAIWLAVWAFFNVDFLTLIWINGIGFTAVLFPLLYALYCRWVSANAIFVTSMSVLAILVYWFFFSGQVDLAAGTFGDLVLMYMIGYGITIVLPPLLSLIWRDDFDFSEMSAREQTGSARSAPRAAE